MSAWLEAGGFGRVQGQARAAGVLEEVWDVYAGQRTANTLERVIAHDRVHGRSYFVNDNCWWQYTDAQCNWHGTYGWRPFFDARYREVDRDTWRSFSEYQVDEALREHFARQSPSGKAPPVGFFPHSVFPEKGPQEHLSLFYSNSFAPGDEGHERHDEQIDYQLLHLVTASDWVLFERDGAVGHRLVDEAEAFMGALERRMEPDGMLRVGPQGSQAEFSHGGWRYPATTHVYLAAACRCLAEVAGLLELQGADGGAAAQRTRHWQERAQRQAAVVARFAVEDRWLAGSLDLDRRPLGTGRLDGSPSSYFETWPNLDAIALGVARRGLAESVLERMDQIPQLTANTLVLNNYPERPAAEMDGDHGGFPPPGAHMNGGSWWMLSGSRLYALAAAQRPETWEYAERLLATQRGNLIIDYYNDWGADPASQWLDKGNGSPGHHSIGAAGALGMLFRAVLGLTPVRDGLHVAPRLPAGVDALETTSPVLYGGKRVFFALRGEAGTGPGRAQPAGEALVSFGALRDGATISVG